MFTTFLALVRKDLKLFFSDRRALLMSIVAPIAIASFFGYIFGGSGDRRKPAAFRCWPSTRTAARFRAKLWRA